MKAALMDHTEHKKSKCRSCGQPIIFIKLESGNFCPCDPQLKAVQTDEEGKSLVLVVGDRIRRNDLLAGEVGYISHFATCDHPELFRKK